MVKKLDDSVGTVVAALQRRGMLENTIIVFTSDNGAPTGTQDYPNWGSNYPFRGVSEIYTSTVCFFLHLQLVHLIFFYERIQGKIICRPL